MRSQSYYSVIYSLRCWGILPFLHKLQTDSRPTRCLFGPVSAKSKALKRKRRAFLPVRQRYNFSFKDWSSTSKRSSLWSLGTWRSQLDHQPLRCSSICIKEVNKRSRHSLKKTNLTLWSFLIVFLTHFGSSRNDQLSLKFLKALISPTRYSSISSSC